MSQYNVPATGGGGGSVVETLTGNTGGAVGPSGNNINVVGDGSTVTVAGDPGTNTLTITAIGEAAYYSFSPFMVGTDPAAQYSTIAAGIAAAVTAGASASTPLNVYIKPKVDGTSYTEDVTLVDGVNLVSLGEVIVIGKMSCSTNSTIDLYGITLQTNSDFCVELSQGNISFFNCAFNVTNNNGIHLTGSATTIFYNCLGALAATYAYFIVTSSNPTRIYGGHWDNGGGSVAASTFANTGSTDFTIENASFFNSVTSSGTTGYFSFINSTLEGEIIVGSTDAKGSELVFCNIGGTVSIGAGANCIVDDCQVASAATNPITGSGTLIYGLISFSSTGHGVNTTTQTPLITFPSLGSSGITTLEADDSGTATGSTVTISGGSTGLTTTASSATMDLTGTLVVGNGGTGDASFTAYAPVCGGTTTTGALQSASTGISTSGYVLTSNGSSTLPSFKAAPSNFVLIQQTTISTATASIPFINIPTNFTTLLLCINGCQPDTATASLEMLISQDNGSTYPNMYINSGLNYTGYNSVVPTNVNSTTFAYLSYNQDSNPNATLNGYMYMSGFNYVQLMCGTGNMTWVDNSSNIQFGNLLVRFSPPNPGSWNAFKLFYSTGNILQGIFTLYGLT